MPVARRSGRGRRAIGQMYPTTYFLTIARGAFSKALGFAICPARFLSLRSPCPSLVGLSILLLRKQER